MSGKLVLIPTPIDDISELSVEAKNCLSQLNVDTDIIVVEELKTCRRRWLRWGLSRDWIERFKTYNEHDHKESRFDLLAHIKNGGNVYIMSDCGLPAFCDPGRLLVDECHRAGYQVTSLPFSNSIALAIALSGFSHDEFHFYGFIPQRGDERAKVIQKILKNRQVSVVMDTPYRLEKTLLEFQQIQAKLGIEREYFLGLELNQPDEKLLRGSVSHLLKDDNVRSKKEFILILNS